MTYTIIARCERTGRLGIGIATYSLAVGGYCPHYRKDVGLISSQAFVNPALGEVALAGLASGSSPEEVVAGLSKHDSKIEYRQVGIVAYRGGGACLTGSKTRNWAGHMVGEGVVAFGNALSGEAVVRAMSAEFEATFREDLAERLMRSLEAGRAAGGQSGDGGRRLSERSAAVVVKKTDSAPGIDLRIDVHYDAVTELRRALGSYRPYMPYYEMRRTAPEATPPQEQWPPS